MTLEDVGTPALTAPFNLFIYRWPLEEQAKSPGNVTAIEYCFQRSTSTLIQPVFTLLLLKPSIHGYRISNTIAVTAKSFSSCSYRGGINTCCERRQLRRRDQYSVPSADDIEAFGIFATGVNCILGFRSRQQKSTLGFQVPASAIQNNDFIALSRVDTITINYRMFNFVIGKVPSLAYLQ